MNETFWVLEYVNNGRKWYYGGDASITSSINKAFRYGNKGLAEEFLSRAKTDSRIKLFANYVPVEYQEDYKRV
jgi:hypothetical protein